MTEIGHVHQWRSPVIVRDFCHYSVTEKWCNCGFTRCTETERNFGLNPIQIAFADPSCPRCRELARGHEPDSWKAERREGRHAQGQAPTTS
jgi:hypothetical protein